ncbi:MAG: hypothetical protein [Podoviridae sp. ctQNx1]|nr:MAG: hypothetical protein [Podoviridae sp. ctQNx1]UOF78110.1 hypothetical protein [Caudoviricetes sp.]
MKSKAFTVNYLLHYAVSQCYGNTPLYMKCYSVGANPAVAEEIIFVGEVVWC